MKRQPTEWKKILTNDVLHKGLISKIYKELLPDGQYRFGAVAREYIETVGCELRYREQPQLPIAAKASRTGAEECAHGGMGVRSYGVFGL